MNFLQQYLSNVRRGPVTTGAAILIAILSIIAFFVDKATIMEMIEGIAIGAILAGCPDPGKGATFVLVLLAGLSFSCRPLQIVGDTKTETTYRDSTIVRPGETVSAIINQDSILKLLKHLQAQGQPPKVVYNNGPAGKTHLTFSLDNNGQLKADCSRDDEVIKLLLKEIHSLKTQIHIVKETPNWVWYLVAGLGSALLVCICLLVFKPF